ncbi:MAG: class I SAM-dependent methyltransferase [Bacteroidales bacterium]|nr:class I SAM-dependent methyltransferase [Bacteroidales bacterium]
MRLKNNAAGGDNFENYILNQYLTSYSALSVEDYRNELLSNHNLIEIFDCGTGSKTLKSPKRIISKIAKTSAAEKKHGMLFQKIVQEYAVKSVLELGTSLGVGTMYFALAGKNINVTSIEACPETHKFTKTQFAQKGIMNVDFINNNFDAVFDNNELAGQKFDLIYIDGNHNSKSLIKYYDYLNENLASDKCIYIIDDINWSTDMYRGWKNLCNKNKDAFNANIFRVGLIFKNYKDLPKGNFYLKFVNKL